MKKKIKKDKKKKSALDLFIALSWTLKMKKSEYYIFFKRNYYNLISKMIRQKEKLNSIRLEKMVIKYIKAV